MSLHPVRRLSHWTVDGVACGLRASFRDRLCNVGDPDGLLRDDGMASGSKASLCLASEVDVAMLSAVVLGGSAATGGRFRLTDSL